MKNILFSSSVQASRQSENRQKKRYSQVELYTRQTRQPPTNDSHPSPAQFMPGITSSRHGTNEEKRKSQRVRRKKSVIKYSEVKPRAERWWGRENVRLALHHKPVGAFINIANITFSGAVVFVYYLEMTYSEEQVPVEFLNVVEFFAACFFTVDLILQLYCGELNSSFARTSFIAEGSFANSIVYMCTEGLWDLVVIIPIFANLAENGFTPHEWDRYVSCKIDSNSNSVCWNCYQMGLDICPDIATSHRRPVRFGIFLGLFKIARLIKVVQMTTPSRLRRIMNGSRAYLHAEPFVLYFLSFVFQFVCLVFISSAAFYVADVQLYPYTHKGIPREDSFFGEPLAFGDCVYFIIVTMGTIGYGDISPRSFLGNTVCMVVIIICMVYIPNKVIQVMEIYNRGMEAQLQTFTPLHHGCHIIIIGPLEAERLNTFVRGIFTGDHAKHRTSSPITSVVLLSPGHKSSSIARILLHPMFWSRVHYVSGHVTSHQDLRRAGFFHPSCKSCLLFTCNSYTDQISKFVMLKAYAKHYNAISSEMNIMTQVHYREEKEHLLLYTDSSHDKFMCLTEVYDTLIARGTVVPGLVALIDNLVHTIDNTEILGKMSNKIMGRINREYVVGTKTEIYIIPFPRSFMGLTFRMSAKTLFSASLSRTNTNRPVILIGAYWHAQRELFLNPADTGFTVRPDEMFAIVLADSNNAAHDAFQRVATRDEYGSVLGEYDTEEGRVLSSMSLKNIYEKKIADETIENEFAGFKASGRADDKGSRNLGVELKGRQEVQHKPSSVLLLIQSNDAQYNSTWYRVKKLNRMLSSRTTKLVVVSEVEDIVLEANGVQDVDGLVVLQGSPTSGHCLLEADIFQARSVVILRPSTEGEINLQSRHGFILQCYEAVRHCLHQMPQMPDRGLNGGPFVICEAASMSTILGLEYLSTASKKVDWGTPTSLYDTSHTFISFFAGGHCTSGSFVDSLFAQAAQGIEECSIYEIVKEMLQPDAISLMRWLPKTEMSNMASANISTYENVYAYFLDSFGLIAIAMYRYDEEKELYYVYTAPHPDTVVVPSDMFFVLQPNQTAKG